MPLLLASAFVASFVLSGGVGATMRLLARRGRELQPKWKLGPLVLLDKT